MASNIASDMASDKASNNASDNALQMIAVKSFPAIYPIGAIPKKIMRSFSKKKWINVEQSNFFLKHNNTFEVVCVLTEKGLKNSKWLTDNQWKIYTNEEYEEMHKHFTTYYCPKLP